jgi:type II secretory pathway pseudopilin PulG
MVILGILITATIIALNPLTQIQKSQDAQRKEDLKQLNSAFDTYYNDKNCYPQLTQAPISGTYWLDPTNKSTIYMQKVPADPSVTSGWVNYAYVTDTNTNDTCPQWNVIFAKVTNAGNADNASASTLCPLANIPGCLPKNFDDPKSRYNYCVISGNLDETACTVVSSLDALSPSGPTSIPGMGLFGGGSSNPPPTIPPSSCLCASTVSHAFSGQSCQAGGWSDSGFNHNIYNFYCNNNTVNGSCGGSNNPAATDCQ